MESKEPLRILSLSLLSIRIMGKRVKSETYWSETMINILVVEDDKHVRKLMNAVLKREGYKVLTAENGIQALEVLEVQHIDLIILDIMMPGMDGYEFAEELRNANNTIPILMATAKQLPEDKKKDSASERTIT